MFKLLLCMLFISIHAVSATLLDDTVSQEPNSFPLYLRTLNPAKGVTVWRSPEIVKTIKWWSRFGEIKTSVVVLDGEFEITVSPFTWRNDYSCLLFGLHHYNLSKIDPSYHAGKSFKYPHSEIKGDIYGESVDIKNLTLKHLTVLPTIEKDAWTEGGRRIYVELVNARELGTSDPENTALYTLLQKQGYSEVSCYRNFMTGGYVSMLMKEITGTDTTAPLTIEWETDIDTAPTIPVLSENFGVFVRDSTGTVQGGIWGSLVKGAHHPHADIHTFFMDESVRGTGLGKLTMGQVEDYVKSSGITLLALGTCDFQAPKLYEKIGYVRDATTPKILKGRDREYCSSYLYHKPLS